MDFTRFYGSRRHYRLKLVGVFLILLLNVFIMGLLMLLGPLYSLLISSAVAASITVASSKNPNLRFVRLNTLMLILFSSLLVAFFSLASPRW